MRVQTTDSNPNVKTHRGLLTRDSVYVLLAIVIIIVTPLFTRGVLNIALRSEIPLVVVTSESMIPTIQVGDLGLVMGVPPSNIEIGSIIVFQATWRPDNYPPVIHRVINITTDDGGVRWFTTQGDNSYTNPNPDPAPCPESRVYGVAVIIIPKLGLLTLWLQSGYNYYFVLAGVGTILIIILFYDRTKE